MRELLVKFFCWYFRRVKDPATLSRITQATRPTLLVTLSNSVIIEGLLKALAHKAGIHEVTQLDAQELPQKFAAIPHEGPQSLYWISLHDTAALQALVALPTPPEIITFNVFQVRGPVRTPPQHRLSFSTLIGLILTRRLLFIVFGNPLSAFHTSVARLQRALKVDFYRNLKLVRGTPLQSIEAQSRIVLAGQEFERELRILAERAGESPERMRRRAQSVFEEIAANPRRLMYVLLGAISRCILKRLFGDVVIDGLDNLKPAIKDHPVVLVPMHRSHLDYIVLQYKLYQLNISPPLVAAGINLSFFPVGFLTRSVGAYFVKRNARDRLHTVVLRRYVTYLVKRGHLQEFFIEGGRSRSGKMLPPKVGLLGILFDAYRQGLRRDILFVPVSLSYEQVVEDAEFGEENTGRSKKKENVVSLLRAINIFNRKYGEVIVRFGPAQSLASFVKQKELTHSSEKTARAMRNDDKNMMQEFGLELVRSIRMQISPSLTNLAHTALMLAPHYGLTQEQLVKTIKNLAWYLTQLRKRVHNVGDFTPSLQRFLDGRESLLYDITRGGNIEVRPCLGSEVFFIPGEKRFTADFYRNSFFHLFFPAAIFSTLHLLKQPLSLEQAQVFHTLFAQDLLLPAWDQFSSELEATLQILRDEQIISEDGEARRFIKYPPGIFIPTLLLSSIQSLLWVKRNLKENVAARADDPADNDRGILRAFSYTGFIAMLQNDFQAARYTGVVTQTEAASKTAIQGALEVMNLLELISFEERSGQRTRILVRKEEASQLELLEEAHRAILQWSTGAAVA